METLLIIDGSSLLHRAFYAEPLIVSPDGQNVGAVTGFGRRMIDAIKKIPNSHIVVIFDAGGKTSRHDVHPEYKANRKAKPDGFVTQGELVRELCNHLGIEVFERKGVEADDLIASITTKATERGLSVAIVSEDKDLMQLVSDKPRVEVHDTKRNIVYNSTSVKEKFGVWPRQISDMLALTGDASDNIPGVPGIGPKRAASLLQKYQVLENIFALMGSVDSLNKIRIHEKTIRKASQLVELNRDETIDSIDIDDLHWFVSKIWMVHIDGFCQKLGLPSLRNEIEDLASW